MHLWVFRVPALSDRDPAFFDASGCAYGWRYVLGRLEGGIPSRLALTVCPQALKDRPEG